MSDQEPVSPPVERHAGAGASRFGRTWWGKRWLRTLEQLGLTYPDSRMTKARSLVRNEAVDLLSVEPGELSAWVDQPRKSFGVSVLLPRYSDSQWATFDEVMAARLGNLADLLDDRIPASIDRQLEEAGMSLFPADDELTTTCPCKYRSSICVHVIAVQHAFAVLLDDDPFLLPLLRGRDRDQLLAGIRGARTVMPEPLPTGTEVLPIRELSASDFFSARASLDV